MTCTFNDRYGSTSLRLRSSLLVVLATGLLHGCDPDSSRQKAEFTIVDTGITLNSNVGSFAWCDATHIAAYRQRNGDKRNSEVVYFAINDPAQVRRVNLTNPQQDSVVRTLHVNKLHCFDNQLVFISSPDLTTQMWDEGDRRSSIYLVRPGGLPERLASLREEGTATLPVNLKERYVVGNGRLTKNLPTGSISQDCATYIKPGFRFVCMDTFNRDLRATASGVILQYRWDDQIQTSYEKDNVRFVPNPEPPLLDQTGTAMTRGYFYFLRDVENRVIRQIPMQQGRYLIGYPATGPAEPYLYATCYKAGDHGAQYDKPRWSQQGRVCRLDLRDPKAIWHEVFSVEDPSHPVHINNLDVNAVGDLTFIHAEGNKAQHGIWMYSASDQKTYQIRQSYHDESPKVSPDGKAVAFALLGNSGWQLLVTQGTAK